MCYACMCDEVTHIYLRECYWYISCSLASGMSLFDSLLALHMQIQGQPLQQPSYPCHVQTLHSCSVKYQLYLIDAK